MIGTNYGFRGFVDTVFVVSRLQSPFRMQVSLILLACVSCAVTFPTYYFPFSNSRGVSWVRRVLDCPELLYGSYDPSKCRTRRERRPQQSQQLTVLEIIEPEPGRISVHEDEHAGTFAIRVPHQYKLDKPKCKSHEIYVGELDICVEAEEHLVKTKVTDSKRGQEKQKEDKKEPVNILQVGEYEKEKCGPGEIYVPEVDACLDRNPPPPLEPEDSPPKPQRRKKHGY